MDKLKKLKSDFKEIKVLLGVICVALWLLWELWIYFSLGSAIKPKLKMENCYTAKAAAEFFISESKEHFISNKELEIIDASWDYGLSCEIITIRAREKNKTEPKYFEMEIDVKGQRVNYFVVKPNSLGERETLNSRPTLNSLWVDSDEAYEVALSLCGTEETQISYARVHAKIINIDDSGGFWDVSIKLDDGSYYFYQVDAYSGEASELRLRD